jgi:hypothetical protein
MAATLTVMRNIDHIQRMLADAKARLNDADILAQSLNHASDSQALLRILALEVLLKTAQFICNGKYKYNHKYVDFWLELPEYARTQIIEVAELVYPGHTDLSDIEKLLRAYEFVFMKARYYFELYKDYTLAEQQELGEYWVEIGAPIEEADVNYYPMELKALTKGLIIFIENAITSLQTQSNK